MKRSRSQPSPFRFIVLLSPLLCIAVAAWLWEHLSARAQAVVFDPGVFEAPSTRQAAELLNDWGADGPTLVLLTDAEEAAGKSFRNLVGAEAMPVQDAGVADIVGAASLLVSEAALPSLLARAGAATGAAAASESEEAA